MKRRRQDRKRARTTRAHDCARWRIRHAIESARERVSR